MYSTVKNLGHRLRTSTPKEFHRSYMVSRQKETKHIWKEKLHKILPQPTPELVILPQPAWPNGCCSIFLLPGGQNAWRQSPCGKRPKEGTREMDLAKDPSLLHTSTGSQWFSGSIHRSHFTHLNTTPSRSFSIKDHHLSYRSRPLSSLASASLPLQAKHPLLLDLLVVRTKGAEQDAKGPPLPLQLRHLVVESVSASVWRGDAHGAG